jgi:LuxR family transcriptional regulator, maltose regulon positive regulatory protein
MSVSRHGKSKKGTANGAEIGLKQGILLTKLQRPNVAPDIFPRARLLDQLNEGRHRPLTLISAPAGYGKSTLASRWVATCASPSGWVSLDESDSDLRMFPRYVLAAIKSASSKLEFRTEALLEASQLPSALVLAHQLLNDLHQITKPFILVLDDFHRIHETSVHDLVTEVLAYPPQAMHLVLLTRRDPPLPIAKLRGRGQVTEIRSADLRFAPDEAAGFLNKMLKVPVDDDTAALLDQKMEGWVTGLRLAGLYLQGQKDMKLRVQELSGSSGYIAEYLAAEVLSRQHPEMVSYLLETSILDRFCAPLCGQMHQKQSSKQPEFSADQFIQWLVDSDLFVIALDDEGYWFRYHHLFQAFLKGELRKQRTADRIADLHRIAGTWFAENDLIEEAIRHLMAAGDLSSAIQLIVDHRYELMNTSRFFRLNRWLTFLPENKVAENPLLASTRAFIGIEQGKDADAYAFTENAGRMLAALSPKSEAYPILKGEVLVLQSLVDLLKGDAQSGLAHAQEAFDYLPENAVMIRSLQVGVNSACYQMTGNGKQAVAMIRDVLSNSILPANIQARMHYYLCIVQYMEANLPGAMNSSRECLRSIRDLPFFHTRAFANYFLGAGHYLRNELGMAQSALLKVLDEPHAANPSYVAHAGFILACIYLSQDSEVAATQVLDRILAHCQDNDHATALSIIQAFEAEFALRRSDIQRAHQICKHADFDVRPPLWFFYVPQLTPIKCLLAEGTEDSLKKAHTRLIKWEERMRRVNRINVRIENLALLALICQKRNDQAAALKNLQTALDLAESGSWIRTFVDLGMPMMDLLQGLIQQQTGQTFAQLVLKACQEEHSKIASFELDAATKPRISENTPYTVLTRREIDILPLLAEGLSNKEIAARLHIAPVTVKTHLQNIFKKLNTKNRIEALKKSREIGIIIDK